MKIKKTEITLFDVTIETMMNDYCVYEVWKDSVLVFLGTCKFSALPSLSDAQNNSAFATEVPRTVPLTIRVIAFGDRIDCYRHRVALSKVLPELPIYNRRGLFGRFTAIVCEQDGATYRTQVAAAAAYGIAQSNLSAHLMGKPGYTSVGGRTFRKVATL